MGLAPTTASPRLSYLLVNTDFLNSAQHTHSYFPPELQSNHCIMSFSKNEILQLWRWRWLWNHLPGEERVKLKPRDAEKHTSSSESWKHFFNCILLNFLFRGWSEGGPCWQRLNELTFTFQHFGTQKPAAALHINAARGQQAQPPRVALRTDSIFPNKQAHKYIPILNLIQLKSVPSKRFNSPARLFCLTCGSTSSPSPLSLMGTWLQILRRSQLSRVPIFTLLSPGNSGNSSRGENFKNGE